VTAAPGGWDLSALLDHVGSGGKKQCGLPFLSRQASVSSEDAVAVAWMPSPLRAIATA
jgi:hypothetical protein